ncbi:MAG: agmatinase family protein [Bacteroidota bacterium]
MNSPLQNKEFDPSGVGLKNGNFIGLPFDEDSANVVLIPVPWDVTVSYNDGTSCAPSAILDASSQLDLFDPDVKDAWKLGIFMQPLDEGLLGKGKELRKQSTSYISFLENGGDLAQNRGMQEELEKINRECEQMNQWIFRRAQKVLGAGKIPAVIGGDHSVPLGAIKAVGEKFPDFGILQVDAHLDLRNSYEGFTYSHASVFYNALKIQSLKKLVQVGIRDYCEEETEVIQKEGDRIAVYFDHAVKQNQFKGKNWDAQCEEIVAELPADVYVSIDIDGLDPKLCQHTGTPVPGGLDFPETVFLLKKVVDSGRKIIGFDVCETGNAEWDANVAARLIYKLSNLSGRSQKMI